VTIALVLFALSAAHGAYASFPFGVAAAIMLASLCRGASIGQNLCATAPGVIKMEAAPRARQVSTGDALRFEDAIRLMKDDSIDRPDRVALELDTEALSSLMAKVRSGRQAGDRSAVPPATGSTVHRYRGRPYV